MENILKKTSYITITLGFILLIIINITQTVPTITIKEIQEQEENKLFQMDAEVTTIQRNAKSTKITLKDTTGTIQARLSEKNPTIEVTKYHLKAKKTIYKDQTQVEIMSMTQ